LICAGAVKQPDKLSASSVVSKNGLSVFHIGSLLRGDCRCLCCVRIGLNVSRLARVEVVHCDLLGRLRGCYVYLRLLLRVRDLGFRTQMGEPGEQRRSACQKPGPEFQ
jgi:hypothetical protein